MNPHTVVATAGNFMQAVLEQSKSVPVLVDFWAAWCGPCKQLMPTLDRLAQDYGGRFILAKVNSDEEQALAGQLGVRSLPTVVLFKDGAVTDHFVGAVPEGQIRQFLDRHLPPADISPSEQARILKRAGDYSGARAVIEAALLKDANSLELQCELGELLALTSDLDDARAILTSAQSRDPKALPVKRLEAAVAFGDVLISFPNIESLRAQLAANPNNLEARHALAVHSLLAGDYGIAIEDWLGIMRRDRKFKDDLARKSLLMAFDTMDADDPLIADARRAMARLLF